MEPDRQGGARYGANGKEEEAEDIPSTQSLECLDYLKKVQAFQVKMIAIRVRDGGRGRGY